MGGTTHVVVEEEEGVLPGYGSSSAGPSSRTRRVVVATYELDADLIAYGEAIASGDLFAAMTALHAAQGGWWGEGGGGGGGGGEGGALPMSSSSSSSYRSLWMRLCREAMDRQELDIAEQCAAALRVNP